MSNGSGDEWAIVFTPAGAFIRVFDHESELTPYRNPGHDLWPGLLDGLPTAFHPQITEPAFCDEHGKLLATAVLWRLTTDDTWHTGTITFPDSDEDGSDLLDVLLDDIAEEYLTLLEEVYEIDADPAVVKHVLAHRPLTDDIVRALNPDQTLAALHDDITAIGYPR
jgi:hypothetical protein